MQYRMIRRVYSIHELASRCFFVPHLQFILAFFFFHSFITLSLLFAHSMVCMYCVCSANRVEWSCYVLFVCVSVFLQNIHSYFVHIFSSIYFHLLINSIEFVVGVPFKCVHNCAIPLCKCMCMNGMLTVTLLVANIVCEFWRSFFRCVLLVSLFFSDFLWACCS